MPLVRKRWEDISEYERHWEHLNKSGFEWYQDELEKLIISQKAELSPEEFAVWIESMRQGGVEWVD